MKERRVALAREINKINMELINLGEWDSKRIRELEIKKAELDAERLATFSGEEEYVSFKAQLEAAGPNMSKFSSSYTEVFLCGVPRVQWPETYTTVEPEWMMNMETRRLEEAAKAAKAAKAARAARADVKNTLKNNYSKDDGGTDTGAPSIEVLSERLKKAWGVNK